ncbi:SRPBCC family protein [Microbaculum sp. FT89]|uniref:SRPBCC family protein n=1 Tax=Microbaculum sp. FT89 TaxID=3447298 RepID=UPI003F53677A
MRWMIRIVAGLIVITVALAAIGVVFLPRTVAVSRFTVIDAPPAEVWPFVSDLRRFNDWSPWAGYDPEGTRYVFEGPESGVGQIMRWTSDHPNVGSGTLTVVAYDPGRAVEMRLEFGETGTAETTVVLISSDEGTEATWGFMTDLGTNPVARLFGLMFDSWVGNDYETGLANLKALVEQNKGSSG